MGAAIVTFETMSYMYPRSPTLVLRDISLEVQKGEFLGIIGPTGAGKSTLCLTFNGIVPQFYGGRFFGRVLVAGLDTLEHSISELAKYVGIVFEDPETQLITTSVENEIAFPLENLKVPRDEIIRRIPQVLEMVRLEGTEKKHPQELSGGQKQRLAIAAALAVQPAVLVLDEPTSQLDPMGSEEVFSTVRELNKEAGITIVMASHSAEEMAEYADRVILLSDGAVQSIGTPDEIYSDIRLLERHHLRAPEVAQTFFFMREWSAPVQTIPVTMDQGKACLSTLVEQDGLDLRANSSAVTSTQEHKVRSSSPLLSVQDLWHVYPDGTEALKGVSLDIHEGEYLLIVGQNGAGKSTLVKHFLKLLEPSEGKVFVAGKDVTTYAVSDLASKIGYIAQNPDTQIFTTTVEEEVSFALKNLGFTPEEIENRTTACLDSMGLLDMRKVHPRSLPKGDRARVVIAAILAMEPEIIIFDEPTTGQDFRGAKYILDVSNKLQRMGKTVLVITHHLYLMPEYAERVIVMGKGTILLDAPIRQAFHEADVLRSTFLKPPQAVLLCQELCQLTGKPKEAYPLLTPQELAEWIELPIAKEIQDEHDHVPNS